MVKTANIKLVKDRWEVIEKFVVDKEVLDVGCTELLGTVNAEAKMGRWIHEKIKKKLKRLSA